MTRVVLHVALLALLLTPRAATAQDPRQNAPVTLRFLRSVPVLVAILLRWGCRAGHRQRAMRPATLFPFVVHGLWPQYDNGFPEYCQIPAPRLNRGIVSSMLDLMPAPRLIFNEWDRHGTCSGQSPRAHFETERKARAVVKIPTEFADLKEPLSATPHEVRGLHQGQSWPLARRDSDRLRCQALDGGPALPFQGSALSRLCGDC